MLGVNRILKSGFVHVSVHDTASVTQLRRGQRWLRRFVTLFESGRLTIASDDKAAAVPVDVCELSQCRQVVLVDESLLNAPFVVGLQFAHKTYYLRATDQTDFDKWQERLASGWRSLHDARNDTMSISSTEQAARQPAYAAVSQPPTVTVSISHSQRQSAPARPPYYDTPPAPSHIRSEASRSLLRQSSDSEQFIRPNTNANANTYSGPSLQIRPPRVQQSAPGLSPTSTIASTNTNASDQLLHSHSQLNPGATTALTTANPTFRYSNIPLPQAVGANFDSLRPPSSDVESQPRLAISPSSAYRDARSPTASVMTVRTANRHPAASRRSYVTIDQPPASEVTAQTQAPTQSQAQRNVQYPTARSRQRSPTSISNTSFNLETRSLNEQSGPRSRTRGSTNAPPDTADAPGPEPQKSTVYSRVVPTTGPPLSSRSRVYRQASILATTVAGEPPPPSGDGLRRSTESLDTALKKLENQTPATKQGTGTGGSLYESCLKKGWLYKMAADGKTQTKHWFVLNGNSLKYYRDSRAEELQETDGRIELASCDRVQPLETGKNFPFQLTTRLGTFTLSAMTSGIRANWLICLQKCINMSKSTHSLRSSTQGSSVNLQASSSDLVQPTPQPQSLANTDAPAKDDVGVYFAQRTPQSQGATQATAPFVGQITDRRRRSRLSETIAYFQQPPTTNAPQPATTTHSSSSGPVEAVTVAARAPQLLAQPPVQHSTSTIASDWRQLPAKAEAQLLAPKTQDRDEDCDAEVSEILANAADLGQDDDAAEDQAQAPVDTGEQPGSSLPKPTAVLHNAPNVHAKPTPTSATLLRAFTGSSLVLGVEPSVGSAFAQRPNALTQSQLDAAETRRKQLESVSSQLATLQHARDELERFFADTLANCESQTLSSSPTIAVPGLQLVRNAQTVAATLLRQAAQLRDSSAKCDALRAERDSLRSQCATSNTYAQEAETEALSAQKRAKQAEEDFAASRRECEQLRERVRSFNAVYDELAEWQRRADCAEHQLATLRAETDAKVRALETELGEKSRELDALIRQLRDLERLLSNRLDERNALVDSLIDYLDEHDADTPEDPGEEDEVVEQYRRLFIAEPGNLAHDVAALSPEERASAFLTMLFNPDVFDDALVQSEGSLLTHFAYVYRRSFKLVRYFLLGASVDFLRARSDAEQTVRNENRSLKRQLAAIEQEHETRLKQLANTLDSLLRGPSPDSCFSGAFGDVFEIDSDELRAGNSTRSLALFAKLKQQLEHARSSLQQLAALDDTLHCVCASPDAKLDSTTPLATLLMELRGTERAILKTDCELARCRAADSTRCDELAAKRDTLAAYAARLLEDALAASTCTPESASLRDAAAQLISELLNSYDGELDFVAQPKLGALVTPPPSASALTDRSAAQLANEILLALSPPKVDLDPADRLQEATRAFLDSAVSSAKLATLATNENLLADPSTATSLEHSSDRLRQLRAFIYLQSKVHSAVLQKLAVPLSIVRAHGDAASQLVRPSPSSTFSSPFNSAETSDAEAREQLVTLATQFAACAFQAATRMDHEPMSNALLACLQRCARVLFAALRALHLPIAPESQRAQLLSQCQSLGSQMGLSEGDSDVHDLFRATLVHAAERHLPVDLFLHASGSLNLFVACCLVDTYVRHLDTASVSCFDEHDDDADSEPGWKEFSVFADELLRVATSANKAALVDALQKRVGELDKQLAQTRNAPKCVVTAHAELEKEAEGLKTQLRYIKDDYDAELWRMREAHRRELTRVRDEATRERERERERNAAATSTVSDKNNTTEKPRESNVELKDREVQVDDVSVPTTSTASSVVWVTPPPFALNESQIRKRFGEQIADMRTLLERNFVRIEEIRRETLEQIDVQHRDELERLRREQEQRLSLEERRARSEREALRLAHESELQSERARFQHEIAAMRSQAEVDALARQHVEQIAVLRAQLQQLTEQFSIKCIEKSMLEQRVDYIERLATISPAPNASPLTVTTTQTQPSAPAFVPVPVTTPMTPTVSVNERDVNRLRSQAGTVADVLGMAGVPLRGDPVPLRQPRQPPPAATATAVSPAPLSPTSVIPPPPPPPVLGTREQRRSLVRSQRVAAQVQLNSMNTENAPDMTSPRRAPPPSDTADTPQPTVNRRRLIDRDNVPIVSRRSYLEPDQSAAFAPSSNGGSRSSSTSETHAAVATNGNFTRGTPAIRMSTNANVVLSRPLTVSVPAAPRVRRALPPGVQPVNSTTVVHTSAPTAL